MGVGAGLYMYDVVVKKFTFTISSLMSSCYSLVLNRFIQSQLRLSRTLEQKLLDRKPGEYKHSLTFHRNPYRLQIRPLMHN